MQTVCYEWSGGEHLSFSEAFENRSFEIICSEHKTHPEPCPYMASDRPSFLCTKVATTNKNWIHIKNEVVLACKLLCA